MVAPIDARVCPDPSTDIDVSGPILKITVGPPSSQKTFYIHETLCTTRSQFFHLALRGTWKESLSKSINLPEDSPEIFALYVHLLYTNSIPIKTEAPEDVTEIQTYVDTQYETLASLYILAEKLQDTTTKDILTDTILSLSREKQHDGTRYYPGEKVINIIYEGTVKECGARRMVRDFYAEYAGEEWFPEQVEGLPKEFLWDLVRVLVRRKGKGGSGVGSTAICDAGRYHEKVGEEE
ncbi:hypothetical protein CC78DRAFT_518474 [Lojkania enalia]|uniref:BTB domain-containing protein n=1 Tax=Lojkania enalia TaxID=147567 RepID=A0A9P4N5N2_9PLEO|nr:hypothetical protein CC78DRAFT_518474 [Didymosphaeria enalia]